MTSRSTSYLLPPDLTSRALIRHIQEIFATRRRARPRLRLTYLDTFDWRLHRAGKTLSRVEKLHSRKRAAARTDDAAELRLGSLEGAAPGPAAATASGALPAFAEDFSPGVLHDAVAPLIAMRRLLPIATVETTGEEISLLDGREKTVARVTVERGRVSGPGGPQSKTLPPRLVLAAVRSCSRAFSKARSLLEDELDLAPVPGTCLDDALAAIGCAPESYTSSLQGLFLDRGTPADEALKIILRRLLATLRANEDGIKGDLDTEFLHDFRVAARRTRSALTQIKGVLPAARAEEFNQGFRWLGSLTGTVRDLDVYLLKMPAYKESLPAEARRDLAPLERFLHRHRQEELKTLVRQLSSARYRRLVREWERFLTQETPEADRPAAALQAIEDVAGERIWRAFRRVLRRGREAASEDVAPEALHRVRIDAKKLRYLLEFFRSLYERQQVRPLITTLKRLQDNLGDFNDYQVQQTTLKRFAVAMSEEESVPVATQLAMGRLIERLGIGQETERRRFASTFATFDSQTNRKRYRELLARGTKGEP